MEEKDHGDLRLRVGPEVQIQKVFIRSIDPFPLEWEGTGTAEVLSSQGLKMTPRQPPGGAVGSHGELGPPHGCCPWLGAEQVIMEK